MRDMSECISPLAFGPDEVRRLSVFLVHLIGHLNIFSFGCYLKGGLGSPFISF